MKLSEWRARTHIMPHEADMLISHICGIDKAHIIAYGSSYELSESDEAKLNSCEARRLSGEPIQYILGFAYFIGHRFKVTPDVLIPRMDTELLVYEALKECRKAFLHEKALNCLDNISCSDKINCSDKIKILDMCSGSGCIGISAVLGIYEYLYNIQDNIQANNIYGRKPACHTIELTMSDISESAMDIARENAEALLKNSFIEALNATFDIRLDIKYIISNFWDYWHGSDDLNNCGAGDASFNIKNTKNQFDIILSNPPYIPEKDIRDLDIDVRCHEPYTALCGGQDGLYAYREIANGIHRHIHSQTHLFLEVGINQARSVREIFLSHFNSCDINFNSCDIIKDLSGIERVLHLYNI